MRLLFLWMSNVTIVVVLYFRVCYIDSRDRTICCREAMKVVYISCKLLVQFIDAGVFCHVIICFQSLQVQERSSSAKYNRLEY